jgi:hypothetical protein
MPLPAVCNACTDDSCKQILEEVVGLLEVMRQPPPCTDRLNFLLATHFGSTHFRSFCCFGHDGDFVSLEPSNDWKVRLDFAVGSSTIQPVPVDPSFSTLHYLLKQKYELVRAAINTLLLNVVKFHKEKDFINAHLPRIIGASWSLAMLGLKDSSAKFVVPPLPELRRRITLSLDGAVVIKRSLPASKFFSEDTGFLWQTLDDSFDVNKEHLEACSLFPKRFEKLLDDSGKTLDQLAGVAVLHRYPKVEAIVRDALSRGQKHGLESVDLKLADGSLGGTVFALHNAHYSVEWIASYLVDTAVDPNNSRVVSVKETRSTPITPSWRM